MKSTPIILDVDAGVDDTLAIIFSLLSPALRVRAITTVAGNVPVSACTRNVLLTLHLLSGRIRMLPIVAQGASKPLKRKLFTAPEVHGSDGIGNASRLYDTPPLAASSRSAVEVILDVLRREPNTTVVATGPLTNIAAAIAADKATMKRAREIVVMGGAFHGMHNTGPVAEFNFYVDPEAADCVMRSGLPVRLIPLNVTEQCVLTPQDLRSVSDPIVRRYLQRITKVYFDFHKRTINVAGGYLHDPLAAGSVAFPSLLKFRRGYVSVEWTGTYSRGLSIFFPQLAIHRNAKLPDWVKRDLRRTPTVRVATSVDANSFKKKFLKTVRPAR